MVLTENVQCFLFKQTIAGDRPVGFNNTVFLSERSTSHRNFAMAYYMKEHKCFPPEIKFRNVLDMYFQARNLYCDSSANILNIHSCPVLLHGGGHGGSGCHGGNFCKRRGLPNNLGEGPQSQEHTARAVAHVQLRDVQLLWPVLLPGSGTVT